MRRQSSPRFAHRIPRQNGYALILMLVLVTMGILYTLVSQVSLVGKKVARAESTSAAMVQAKEALIGYAATYRDTHPGDVSGYLPCPDINGDGSADALSSDCGGADGRAVIGLLPYKQLGLPSNQDADGNCLWYAVSGTFKASANPNLPAPMNWDTQGQIEVRDANNGLIAQPNDANGGAAAVIFSVGIPNAQQTQLAITPAAICGVSSSSRANVYYANYIDVDPAGIDPAKSQPFPGPVNTPVRVVRGTIGSSINNDQILAVTSKDIFARIKQRSDLAGILNTLTAAIVPALEGKVAADLAVGTAPISALPITPTTISGPAYVGRVGSLPSLTFTGPSDTNLLSNWSEQYRLITCNNFCGYCLTVGGQNCNGALLFGGEHHSGGPRPVHPLQLADLFETSGAPLVNGTTNTFVNGTINAFSGAASYASGSADVGMCIAPSNTKPVTFSCDINTFIRTSTHSGAGQEASINTATATVTLGSTSASSAGSGCVWYPNALPFNSLLRTYFKFRIVNRGEGFVFALADAARNASGPVCGSTTADRLGYDGNTYPKFGLEIDTRLSAARSDPSINHYAFLYWGTTAITTDDNTHNSGIVGSAVAPLNPTTSNVLSASWSSMSSIATITTSTTHGLTSGQRVNISGVTPTSYNGSYQISVTDTTHFNYSLTPTPGTYSSGGLVTSGLATLLSSDTQLPYTTWPLNTDIHVRLDIVKAHSGASATYTLKAYVATTFPTCSLADFQNVTRNLNDLCVALNPGIEQDAIVIDDISGFGEAMANVYAGFTSAQGATAASNESIDITNFIIRSQ